MCAIYFRTEEVGRVDEIQIWRRFFWTTTWVEQRHLYWAACTRRRCQGGNGRPAASIIRTRKCWVSHSNHTCSTSISLMVRSRFTHTLHTQSIQSVALIIVAVFLTTICCPTNTIPQFMKLYRFFFDGLSRKKNKKVGIVLFNKGNYRFHQPGRRRRWRRR